LRGSCHTERPRTKDDELLTADGCLRLIATGRGQPSAALAALDDEL